MKRIGFFLFFIAVILLACQKEPCHQYSYERSFDKTFRDSLLIDLVTLIGRRPEGVAPDSRFDKQYRQFYIAQSVNFHVLFFHKGRNDTCYYYLLRDARSLHGRRRAVGGKFILDKHGGFKYFEETFNTRVLDPQILKEKGCILFTDWMKTGDISKYLSDREFIEWPDDRVKYDTQKREWRYDVVGRN